jgi:iron(III) transport system ATP-binding protein
MAELRCEGLAKSYGSRTVLTDLDLVVPAGTLTAILGASGSGKTTLLRLIIGFITVDRGRVTVGGSVVTEAGRVHVTPDKRSIGYVAQEGALFPHLTVAENVAFGLPRSERKGAPRIGEVLDLVGLDGSYAGRNPHELSGGEQRRVALARALAPRPRLVLLDEPFSGLDAALRAETREAVLNALAGEGTTAVLVTHDQAEALSMGREVALLRTGRLVQTATPSTLYRDPVDLEVARFIGDAVVVAGRAQAGSVECALGTLDVRGSCNDGQVQVMIRPEQIQLVSPSEGGVAAKAIGYAYYGAETVVRLVLDDESRTPVTAKTFDQAVPPAGELVHIVVTGPVVVFPSSTARELEGSARDAEVAAG